MRYSAKQTSITWREEFEMHTRVARRARPGRVLAAILTGALPLLVTDGLHSAQAASGVGALVASAEHNTNTVRTLVHRDQDTITMPSQNVTITANGSEDEVHNREQDYESVTVVGRTGSTKGKKLHYTIDIIFLNGMTYYRVSTLGKAWKSQKGMTFPDPYTGGWKRGRTTVSFPKTVTFHEVGTSGGETHVRATLPGTTVAGTADLWISGGAQPYVVREDENYHTVKGARASEQTHVLFGPFNTPIVITAPSSQSST